MIGHILTEAGLDPTVLVGDGVELAGGPLEAGSWPRSTSRTARLVLHHPRRAIVTNIELDHTDHFKDVEAVQSLFAEFVGGLPADGLAVLCADDERARR